ncbi:MAG: tetratricopeptide repeat protein [Melioribacter sp.]|nr:tetratricopeptide repeat protein [Melioribacter sp.]
MIFKKVTLLIIIVFSYTYAQSHRSLINEGVDLYNSGKYADAEVNFKKSLEKKSDLFEAHFNLGDAYYKQGRFEEAIQSYRNALSFTKDKFNKAKVYHNIGNSLLKLQKYNESVDAYKNALKLNPNDNDTKYNLSYALKMLKENQKQNQQKQNKEQNNQDKNKQNQQNQDQQNKQDQKEDKQKQNQQQQKNQITKEDAERILEALKNNEQDLQKKLRKVKGRSVIVDKDW